MPHLINFPFEIIVEICSYIDLYSLNAFALSCKDLTFVLKHPPLWRHIRFINIEEQTKIESQFLSPLKSTAFKIPYKLSRIDDRRARQLLNMLRKNSLSSVVCSINFDFTSINCTSIWESINGFLNLEEISCRGCLNLSLRDLGTALTWFEPLVPVLKLRKLQVLWCKDMSPRTIMRQRLYVNDVSDYYSNVLFGFLKALKQLKTERPILLDVDCFRFYCGTDSCKPSSSHSDPILVPGKGIGGKSIAICDICHGGAMDLERYIREFFESTKFSKWCLKEAKAYVLAKDSDMNYSPEEFLEIFQRELRLKSNNCNLYKAAKDKAINLLQSMNSDTDDQTLSPENLSFSKITIPDITAKSFEIILNGLLSLEGLRPSEIFDLYYAALKLEIRDIGTFILSIVHFE
ncbi:14278_t:CDS:2 [Gigaspora rosea]|nr:14278_t:CDS:2 [Gigaspora rosea]